MKLATLLCLVMMIASCGVRSKMINSEGSLPWGAVATSMNIVKGRVSDIFKECKERRSCYWIVNVEIERVAKGASYDDSLNVAIYDDLFPVPKSGNSYFFFLSDKSFASPDGINRNAVYLNSLYPEYSVLHASHALGKNLHKVISENKRILESFDSVIGEIYSSQCKRIDVLVNALISSRNVDGFLKEVEDIKDSELVCLVANMENFHLLNSADVEVWIAGNQMFYSPEKVSDLISIVLNRATLKSFGSLSNGDVSDDYRRNVADGWKIFLYKEGFISEEK